MKEKQCPTCKEIKNTLLFYKNKSTKDGYSVQCKQCHSNSSRASKIKWYHSNKNNKCRNCGTLIKNTSIRCYKCAGIHKRQSDGTVETMYEGYVYLLIRNHPKRNKRDFVPRSHVVVEKILGKYLPFGAVVHHRDNNRSNDQLNNLVVCQDKAYHNMIHRKQRSLINCGHASWLYCPSCKTHKHPDDFYKDAKGHGGRCGYCKTCLSKKHRIAYHQRVEGDRKSAWIIFLPSYQCHPPLHVPPNI